MGRPSLKPRQPNSEAGFTIVEVLVALFIVATTIAALQTIASATLKSSVETNRTRIAKMLLRQKAEEIYFGLETSSGGTFEGFPGYSWEKVEQEIPLTDNPVDGVIHVGVKVKMPTLAVTRDEGEVAPEPANPYGPQDDPPDEVRIEFYIDPPTAQLQVGPC
jgi:type II secretory pathway pseudopilin PulG